ncbi:MAG: hypothetical protein AAF542_19420 [Pseudomonadota bacterium]
MKIFFVNDESRTEIDWQELSDGWTSIKREAGRNSALVLPERVIFLRNEDDPCQFDCAHVQEIKLHKESETSKVRVQLDGLTTEGEWANTAQVEIAVNDESVDIWAGKEDFPWIQTSTKKELDGSLGHFCSDQNGNKIIVCEEVEEEFFLFLEKINGVKYRDHRACFALLRRKPGELLFFVVLTSSTIEETAGKKYIEIKLPGLNRRTRISPRTSKGDLRRFRSLHAFPISGSGTWLSGWIGSRPEWMTEFSDIFNDIEDSSRNGRWVSRNSLPWSEIPRFKEVSGYGGVFLFGGNAPRNTWRQFIPVENSREGNEEVKLLYQWNARGEKEKNLELSGKVKQDSRFDEVLLDDVDPRHARTEPFAVSVLDPLLRAATNAASDADLGELATSLRLELQKDNASTVDLPMGAVDLKVLPTETVDVVVRLRSGRDQLSSGYFASATLSDLDVEMSIGDESDPLRKDTIINSAGPAEERLHGYTGGIVMESGANETRNAKLSIDSDTRFTADTTTEIELTDDSGDFVNPDFIYFRPRPFLYAKVSGIQRDVEGGTVIARWRSDDSEGAQWRFPYFQASLELPSQAIGEEMERGNRFWDNEEGPSYINDKKTIRYRFSPSTELSLAPFQGKRRFNPAPTNVFRMIDDAGVVSFRTEIAYPIAVKFEPDSNGRPDLRVRETTSFLGNSVPNLPVVIGGEVPSEVSKAIFESDLGEWSARDEIRHSIGERFRLLRLNNSANKANFASRIAQLHVFDPLKQDFGLFLTEGLEFEIRSHKPKVGERVAFDESGPEKEGQMPALMNPLPVRAKHNDVKPGDEGRDRIASFLKGYELSWADGLHRNSDGELGDDGGIRGGVLHSIEFPSELVAVLRSPSSTEGIIERLSFSNLGATGTMSASFDEGRTTFTADVQNGMISRLVKTRVGRLGIVWNRAKHIVIYERTVVPSTQFDEQQKAWPHVGWPMLRKTEEYIEPIDVIRTFSTEEEADSNSSAFLDQFETISQRIYVDGSWGEEFSEKDEETGVDITGYQIPLWDGGISETTKELDGEASWYYPKPKLAFLSRGEDGLAIRQWIEDPDELVFYTNTVEGAGGDPNLWPAVTGIDAPSGLFRLGILTNKVEDWDEFVSGQAPTAPRPEALRRKRFELRVKADGAVNLQAQRSEKPMFAAMSLLSVARSKEASVPPNLAGVQIPDLTEALKNATDTAEWSGRIGSALDPIQRWLAALPSRLTQFGCDVDAVGGWYKEIDALEVQAKRHVREAFSKLPDASNTPTSESLKSRLKREIVGLSLVDPSIVTAFADEIVEHLDKVILPSTEDELFDEIDTIKEELVDRIRPIEKKIKYAKDVLTQQVITPLHDLIAETGDEAKSIVTRLDDDCITASNALEKVVDSLTDADLEFDVCLRNAMDALEKNVPCALDRADRAPIRELIRQVRMVIASLAQTVRTIDTVRKVNVDGATAIVERLKDKIETVRNKLTGLSYSIKSVITSLERALDPPDPENPDDPVVLGPIEEIEAGIAAIHDDLNALSGATREDVKAKLGIVREHLVDEVTTTEKRLIGGLLAAQNLVKQKAEIALEALLAPPSPLLTSYDEVVGFYKAAIEKTLSSETELLSVVNEVFGAAKSALEDLAQTGGDVCDDLNSIRDTFISGLAIEAENLEKSIVGSVNDLFDEQTIRSLERLDEVAKAKRDDLRDKFGDEIGKVSTGLKLAKAIGDLPELPDLSFNANRAEYNFDDWNRTIATSPIVARAKEINTGLREMGFNVPSNSIFDQFLPTSDDVRLKFNKIVEGMGGFDFGEMLDKFRLPTINEDQYRITHGVDEKSRAAWLKAEVNADYKERQSMFELGAFGIFASDIKLRGRSEMRQMLDGRRDSSVDGRFGANWALQFGGVDLATFRDVEVRYDGDEIKFNVDPSKVEYHPSLKFISDVAKKLEDELPAGVTLIKDARGIPIGADAKMVTLVEKPPPLGPVTIGPLLIEAGLSLLLSSKGQFVVRAFAGVGSKETPVFVQISWLGGGVWATGTIENAPASNSKGRETVFVGSVGVALGNIRAINIANVAKGSYAFLIFANAEFAKGGGILRAGMSVKGSARLLSIANIYVYLLLQVEHSSGGGATGSGLLSAKVKMSRFYTLRVRKAVKRKF